jgi:hypothetical protein
MSQSMLTILWTPIAAGFGRRADRNGRREFVAFYELRHRAAHWMHVELGIHERLVAVQLGHTDGGSPLAAAPPCRLSHPPPRQRLSVPRLSVSPAS